MYDDSAIEDTNRRQFLKCSASGLAGSVLYDRLCTAARAAGGSASSIRACEP